VALVGGIEVAVGISIFTKDVTVGVALGAANSSARTLFSGGIAHPSSSTSKTMRPSSLSQRP